MEQQAGSLAGAETVSCARGGGNSGGGNFSAGATGSSTDGGFGLSGGGSGASTGDGSGGTLAGNHSSKVCEFFPHILAKNGVLNQFSHSLFIEILSRDSLLARTEIKLRTVRKLPSEPSRLSVPVTVRLCWIAQATAAGHQGHYGRCKPQSQGPSLQQREVGAAGTRGGSDPRAGARGRAARMRRAVKAVARAEAIRSQDRADNPLAGARGHAARDLLAGARIQADDCIQWGARYDGLHEYHQISGGYGSTS